MKLLNNINKAFPSLLPRRRYSVFSGTNTFGEWWEAMQSLLMHENADEQIVIDRYETAFAKWLGLDSAFSFGAGRMSFYALMGALGVGRGDEVIIPAFTCVVIPNAILYRGALPIYVDIDPVTFNVDVDAVEAAITNNTRVIYAQHTFGVPCNIEALCKLGEKYGIPVVEDCAHSLGASFKGRLLGSWGDAAFFTTDRSKIMSTHLGGVAVARNRSIQQQLEKAKNATHFLNEENHAQLLRSYLIEGCLFHPNFYWLGKPLNFLLKRMGLLFHFDDELNITKPDLYPFPCRLSAQQSRIGISQLSRLEENIAFRRDLASWLEGEINWYGIKEEEVREGAWLRYSFLIEDRAEFINKFKKYFDLGIWFTSVVSGRDNNLDEVRYKTGSCPIAERVARHIVNFPTHQRIPVDLLKREVLKNKAWINAHLLRIV